MELLWKLITLVSLAECLSGSGVLQRPSFTKQPGSVVFPFRPGESRREVVFSCEAQGQPPPYYRWRLNDSFIVPTAGSRYALVGGNLHISQLNKEQDVGVYQCLASNSFGTIVSREASLHMASGDCKLSVASHGGSREVPLNQDFFTGFGKTVLNAGDVVVSVFIPETQVGEFVRAFRQAPRKENALATVTTGMRVVFGEGGVVVRDIQLYYGGEVVLSPGAVGGKVEFRKSLTLSLLFKFYLEVQRALSQTKAVPEAEWSARRSPVRVREGQGVVLLCGPPLYSGELTFSWIFNEYPTFVVQDTRRFVSQKTGNLYIAKVEPLDVGNYTCVVTNAITKGSVRGPPTPLVLRVDGVMGEYEPKIEVQFPDVVLVAKSSTVRLECFALGNPVPSVSWRRADGTPFGRKVDVNKASGVLEIPYFQQEDTGVYECLAENSRGRNSAKGKLAFYAPPQLLEKPEDAQQPIEDTLVWECKASAKPKPSYRWLKNGEPLDPMEDRVQVSNGLMTINSLKLSDIGMYQCVAE
ncbi:hypothetical protein CRUP_024987, partial [Coryphaenoides rupestris]